jgi:hypothetical protein
MADNFIRADVLGAGLRAHDVRLAGAAESANPRYEAVCIILENDGFIRSSVTE